MLQWRYSQKQRGIINTHRRQMWRRSTDGTPGVGVHCPSERSLCAAGSVPHPDGIHEQAGEIHRALCASGGCCEPRHDGAGISPFVQQEHINKIRLCSVHRRSWNDMAVTHVVVVFLLPFSTPLPERVPPPPPRGRRCPRFWVIASHVLSREKNIVGLRNYSLRARLMGMYR